MLIKNKDGRNDQYIHMGVDFKNIDNDKEIKDYIKEIYDELYENAIDCIHMLGDDVYGEFKEIRDELWEERDRTPHGSLFPT